MARDADYTTQTLTVAGVQIAPRWGQAKITSCQNTGGMPSKMCSVRERGGAVFRTRPYLRSKLDRIVATMAGE